MKTRATRQPTFNNNEKQAKTTASRFFWQSRLSAVHSRRTQNSGGAGLPGVGLVRADGHPLPICHARGSKRNCTKITTGRRPQGACSPGNFYLRFRLQRRWCFTLSSILTSTAMFEVASGQGPSHTALDDLISRLSFGSCDTGT